MPAARPSAFTTLFATLLVTACGGGGDPLPETAAAASAPLVTAQAASPGADAPAPVDRRRQAATATADSASNDCAAVRPFYWELGDARGALVAGSVGVAPDGEPVTASTELRYASATKWLYAAYVAQRREGRLEAWDARMLSMRSGYTHFAGCRAGQTVDACLAWQGNDQFDAAADGRFYYGGAHMQKHASLIGLGVMDAPALASEMRTRLGADVAIAMVQARPAGGATGNAASYTRFLRKLIDGRLALGALLGTDPVCADAETCGAGEVLSGPAPDAWHYSLGHWVEDDPRAGDGAFSSAGAYGFYPWVARDRQHYGVVARDVGAGDESEGAGLASARCGRLIRRAWDTGVAG